MPLKKHVEFRIDLFLGATPITKAPYRLGPPEMQELSNHHHDLIDKGFIRPNSSPCRAPILYVQKKDGWHWMCIDYNELKKLISKNHYPLPTIENLFN